MTKNVDPKVSALMSQFSRMRKVKRGGFSDPAFAREQSKRALEKRWGKRHKDGTGEEKEAADTAATAEADNE